MTVEIRWPFSQRESAQDSMREYVARGGAEKIPRYGPLEPIDSTRSLGKGRVHR